LSAAVETTTWKQKRGKLARLSQDLPPNAPELRELRAELRAQRLGEHIEKILSEAPPLNEEQRTRLAELLRPVRVTEFQGGDIT
jgi:hypothetical protein